MVRQLERWRRRLTPTVLWDGFMVYLALLNVGLILFDITYLWLRPTYFHHVPVLSEYYDRVKGIDAHPLTSLYVEAVDELARTTASEELDEVRDLSRQILESNPFERSGQTRNLARLEVRTRTYIAARDELALAGLEAADAFDRLWSDETSIGDSVAFFQRELRGLVTVNYRREFDLDGNLVDHFWLLDLPFLTIFAFEFAIRWFLAVRRRLYPRWFFFPIFNWYDVLGLVPVRELRFFRLFRVASIYVRLYRSQRTSIGDDVASRTVKYFANIINEEVSDMVSLRILTETQEELKSGTHRRIIRAVATPRRDALARELALRTRNVLASSDVRSQLRTFLDTNLERSVESSEALARLPLPKKVVQPLVEVIGRLVFDAVVETMAATLDTDEGRQALEELIGASIDGLVEELTAGEVEVLVREISLDALERVKKAVAVRKWAEAPDRVESAD